MKDFILEFIFNIPIVVLFLEVFKKRINIKKIFILSSILIIFFVILLFLSKYNEIAIVSIIKTIIICISSEIVFLIKKSNSTAASDNLKSEEHTKEGF